MGTARRVQSPGVEHPGAAQHGSRGPRGATYVAADALRFTGTTPVTSPSPGHALRAIPDVPVRPVRHRT